MSDAHTGPGDELAQLRRWEAIALYARSLAQTADGPVFRLLDRPASCAEDLGFTDLLNRLLKDFTVKYRTLRGEHAPFVPAWDTHGLFLEITALRTFATARHAIPVREVRARCALLARQHCTRQRQLLRRLGIRADWARPVLTLYPAYAEAVFATFRALVERGLVYRADAPVLWCPTCAAPLSAAETAPVEVPVPEAWVAFPVAATPERLLPEINLDWLAVAVRTERVWSLPAAVAVAAGPADTLVLLTDRQDSEGFVYLAAREDAAAFGQAAGMREPARLGEVRGAALAGTRLVHPVSRAEIPLVSAGRGLRALTPGHDREDFAAAQRLGLPTPCCLDAHGCFTADAGTATGVPLAPGARRLLQQLDADGVLLGYAESARPVPHCWRCRQPVVTRLEPRWHLRVDALRAAATAAVNGIAWQPGWGQARLASLLAERPDWRISSRRAWGIPVPAFTCAECGAPQLTPASIAHVAERLRAEGVEAWYTRPAGELLPAETTCPACGGTAFRPGDEVFDVWFATACSPAVSAGPAHFVLESHDHLRGWLQGALLAAVAAGQPAPFQAARLHGLVLDRLARTEERGEVLAPDAADLIARYGADVLRWWAASVDARAEVALSDAALDTAARQYRRVRRVLHRALDAVRDEPAAASRRPVDRWLQDRLSRLIERVTAAYEAGAFHRGLQAIRAFCARDLSAVYLTAADAPSAPAVLRQTVEALARLLAPTASFLADELWARLPGDARPLSAQLADWPDPPAAWRDDALAAQWMVALGACRRIRRAVRPVKKSLLSTRKIVIYAAGEIRQALESTEDALASLIGAGAVECAPRDAASGSTLLPDADLTLRIADASPIRPGVE